MSREEEIDVPILPASVQPKGADYWLGTVSGRLMVINTLVFVAMSWKSGSVILPTREVLLEFGAKDPAGLVNGEYWRFLTPVFVHIGIIHFFFNSLGLYYIGYQLERMLGRRWFLLVYLASGIAGNIASAVTTVVMSAGASGALFGLLGSGYVLERIVGRHIEAITGRRPRRRIYASMVVVNVIFGLLIPGIDNAAHMGGLLTGSLLVWAMLHIRPNRLQSPNKLRAWAAIAALVLACLAGAIRSVDAPAVVRRLKTAAESVQSAEQGVYFLDQALRIMPGDMQLMIERVRFVLMSSDPHEAIPDLQKLAGSAEGRDAISRLVDDFRREGLTKQVRFLEFFLSMPPTGHENQKAI